MEQKQKNNKLILFDGYCLLCDWSVQFILKRDYRKVFTFVSLQSDSGKRILSKYSLSIAYDSSVILIANEKIYFESDAVFKILRNLRGPWAFLYVFIYLPKKFRDLIYRYISKNRFKWFEKKQDCYIPSTDEKNRFL